MMIYDNRKWIDNLVFRVYSREFKIISSISMLIIGIVFCVLSIEFSSIFYVISWFSVVGIIIGLTGINRIRSGKSKLE